jgi:pteridine reductase
MKLALVTGGMRRLGAHIAAELAADGWVLALHSGHHAQPEAHLLEALAAHDTQWHGFHADLSVEKERACLLPRIAAHFQCVPHLLINNAAGFGDDDWRTLNGVNLEQYQRVNCHAPVLLITELARMNPEAQQACAINIVDQRIFQPHGDQLSYTLSKQALAEATRTLARVLAPHMRVNAIAAGLTIPTGEYSAEQMQRLELLMPLERLPHPKDIAQAVVWMAGAPAVTGQIIAVDGGAHMKCYGQDFINL